MNLTDTGVLELIDEAYVKDGCKPSSFWSAAVQQAVINTNQGSTVASLAYSLMHTAVFDA